MTYEYSAKVGPRQVTLIEVDKAETETILGMILKNETLESDGRDVRGHR